MFLSPRARLATVTVRPVHAALARAVLRFLVPAFHCGGLQLLCERWGDLAAQLEWYHGDRRNKPGQQIPRVASGRSLPFRRSNASTNATVNDASMDGMSMNKSALAPDVVLLGFDLWEEYRVRNASEVCAGQGVWLTHSAPAKATASTLHLCSSLFLTLACRCV